MRLLICIFVSLMIGNISAQTITWDDDQSFTLSFYPKLESESRSKNESRAMAKSLCHTLAVAKQSKLVETEELDYFERYHEREKYIEYKAKCIIKT